MGCANFKRRKLGKLFLFAVKVLIPLWHVTKSLHKCWVRFSLCCQHSYPQCSPSILPTSGTWSLDSLCAANLLHMRSGLLQLSKRNGRPLWKHAVGQTRCSAMGHHRQDFWNSSRLQLAVRHKARSQRCGSVPICFLQLFLVSWQWGSGICSLVISRHCCSSRPLQNRLLN